MPYSVAQARKHVETKYAAICESTLETMKAFLEEKKAELAKELDAAVALQVELPMFDLSRYASVEKFQLSNAEQGSAVETLRIGNHPLPINIVLRANTEYVCYFLMREKTEEGAKTS